MTDSDPRDFLIGVPLQSALAEFHHFRAKGKYSHCKLLLNRQSGGIVLLTKDHGEPHEQELEAQKLTHWSGLTSYDLPTVNYLLSDDYAMASLFDYVLNELPQELPRLLHIHALAALSSAFQSAVGRIEQLEDVEKVKGGRMPLSGSLKKTLNYMAILFNDGQYEFLNIVFNMGSKEYELLTPAELDKLHVTGKFGDRRVVLTCTIHELKKITTTDQLRLEIPNAEEGNPPPRENRQLDARESAAGMVDTDEPQPGRSGDDGTVTGPQSDNMESTGHAGFSTE